MNDSVDRENHDNNLNEGFDDSHGKPEGQIIDIEGDGATPGEVIADSMTWIANLNDQSAYTPDKRDHYKND